MNLRPIAVFGTLLLSSTLAAQTTAAFHAYGYGCQSCVTSNADAQTNTAKTLSQGTLPNEYSYGFTAPSNITVRGFAMYTQATTATPFTMDTAFYAEDAATPGQPDAVAAATGTMTAENKEGWYVTTFATPVSVNSGENFWVSGLDSSNILASSITGGDPTTLTIYWRRAGTTWSPTGIVANPGIVLICDETPVLGASNTPKIPSTNFSLDLTNAPAISSSFVVIGISDTMGPLGPLPSDLGLIGFANCVLWSSNEFTFPGFTNTAGEFSWNIPIPNDPTLDGLNFYTQTYSISTANAQVYFSNAGKGTAGTL